jgi:hypothetical protein
MMDLLTSLYRKPLLISAKVTSRLTSPLKRGKRPGDGEEKAAAGTQSG